MPSNATWRNNPISIFQVAHEIMPYRYSSEHSKKYVKRIDTVPVVRPTIPAVNAKKPNA
jgi:hypothetical protein